ncbi:single-stranded DNA-binding protein [Saccharopolyspora cebuensis]|uniref:Single-stranded DNA-binding protein n=1 Tax=Saccharopolyspora cebuensis TaxID=418759 RepID=A0ABV4CI28_9PSEU
MFETTATVVGIVLTDPVTRETANGNRVVSFRLGATSRRFDKATSEWTDGDRFITTVSCWRHLAEQVPSAVGRGDPVVVSGRLRTREYESGGQWRTAVELDASALGLDLARLRGPAPVGADPPFPARTDPVGRTAEVG